MNPDEVKAQVQALLHSHPELVEDNDLLHDMLQGSTDLETIVHSLLRQHAEDRMLVEGIKARRAELNTRKERIALRLENVRATITSLLRLLPEGKRTLRLPEATVAWRKPGTSTIVEDVEALPQGFYRIEKKPRMTEISAALKAGEGVPGARLVDGQDGVTIRTT